MKVEYELGKTENRIALQDDVNEQYNSPVMDFSGFPTGIRIKRKHQLKRYITMKQK